MYILTAALHRKLKSRLTRARNSGDPRKVIAAVKEARASFNAFGYPDDWNRWRIAVDDLTFLPRDAKMSNDERHEIEALARQESDCWF